MMEECKYSESPIELRKTTKFKDNCEYDASTVESCTISTIFQSVASLLTEIVLENSGDDVNKGQFAKSDTKSDKSNKITSAFKGKKPPTISILNYLDRIVKYTKVEDSTLIIALIYLDRLCDINDIQINNLNIHRIILASIIISIKYNEDDFYSNTFYAKVGGISLSEVNALEFEFLKLIRFSLFVEIDLYEKYRTYLINY